MAERGASMVGVLTRADLVKGLTQTGADTPVAAAMTSHFECAVPSEMLEDAVQRLKASGCPAPPVLRDHELVGVLTMENVGEFLMVHSALRANRARATSVACAAGNVSPGSKRSHGQSGTRHRPPSTWARSG
jgi:signal-transduction protein with cAMP-binding, CBS, and nucleotidyltransferase domain